MAEAVECEADLATAEGRVAYLCALVDRLRNGVTLDREEVGHYDTLRKLLSTAHRWSKELEDADRLDRMEAQLEAIVQAQTESSEVIPPEYVEESQDSTEAGDAD